jgi:outer membrane protein assembly factor BamB
MMACLIAALLLFVGVQTTYAVIPELMGPLQSLIALLPQLLVAAAVGLGALFSVRGWRTRLAAWRGFVSKHKTGSVVGALFVGAAITSAVFLLDGRAVPGGAGRLHPGQAAPSVLADSWPTFRGDLARSGNPYDAAGPIVASATAELGEQVLRQAELYSSPSVVGDRLYVSSSGGSTFRAFGLIHCIDATDGAPLWSFKTAYKGFSSPVLAGGRVYIGEGLHHHTDARLYCLDADTGDFVWDFQTRSHVESTPTVVNGWVIFGAGDDGVYCLDAGSGAQIWHAEGLHVDLSPSVVADTVLVGTGYGEMGVYVLDLETGDVLWSLPTQYGVWGSPSVQGGRAYFGLGNGDFARSDPEPYGALLCVDLATREQAWIYETNDAVLTAPAVVGNDVYFGSRDWHLYAVNSTDGTFRWRYDAGAPVLASPAVAQDLVYTASEDGEVAAIDRSTGEPRWRVYLTDAGYPRLRVLASPAIRAGQLFVGASEAGIFVIGDPGTT